MVEIAIVAILALVGSLSGALFAGWLAWRRSLGMEQYRAMVEAYSTCVGKLHDSRRANFHRTNERLSEKRGAEDAAREEAYKLKAGADAAIARVRLLTGSPGVHTSLDDVREAIRGLTSKEIESRPELEDSNEKAKELIDGLVAMASKDLEGMRGFSETAPRRGRRSKGARKNHKRSTASLS